MTSLRLDSQVSLRWASSAGESYTFSGVGELSYSPTLTLPGEERLFGQPFSQSKPGRQIEPVYLRVSLFSGECSDQVKLACAEARKCAFLLLMIYCFSY